MPDDRLDIGQDILDPVIQLVDEQLLDLFGLFSMADVACDLRSPDHLSGPVTNGRNRERDIDAPPVFSDAHGLEMLDPLALVQAREYALLLCVELWRDDPRDRLADHFLAAIAENVRRSCIPGGDVPIESLTDDGIIGRV